MTQTPDYNFTITVPKNTSKDAPTIVEMNFTKGILAGGQLHFPYGCRGYVHCIITDVNGQLYPANADDTFHADGANIPLVGRHILDTKPYRLHAVAWSPTSDYEHKLQLTLSILTEEELSPWMALKELVEIFKRLLGFR